MNEQSGNDEQLIGERSQRLLQLLESDAKLKVIVAGPGTGKTYRFKKATPDEAR